ncbi:MAG: hypothetical protein GHCLOJNM_01801 [bacterium]|nr:hypothetical protein [bacterium]
MDTANLWTWIVSGLCVILVGIAKAGFAGGIGVIATPLLSLVMSPTQAAAILLPLLCGCDAVSIYFYRRVFAVRSLKELLPGSALGIALGALTIAYFQGKPEVAEKSLKMLIGWISILFVIYQVGRAWIQEELERYHPKGWHGWLLGGSAGFTSALAHAGGPPVAMYLLPQHLDRRLFVGTTVWLFAAINAMKLVPYWWLGLFPKENLEMSFFLMPLVPVGVGLGVWMNRAMNEMVFSRIVYTLLFLTGIQLITGWNPVAMVRGWLG